MKPKAMLAKEIGAASSWLLRRVFHRAASSFPGRMALHVDPQLVEDLSFLVRRGSVLVVGTNGKTTVANLIADALEAGGVSVVCNRSGANMESGVATALLGTHGADWGVFETDELWLARIVPQLQPTYVVLLNLFRDQLDRMGEIAHIQTSIADALASSPRTVLVYNADDPLCQAIANQTRNPSTPFGLDCALPSAQDTVVDAQVCPDCGSLLDYAVHQYGQLGTYNCPTCRFHRETPHARALDVRMSQSGVEFSMSMRHAEGLSPEQRGHTELHVEAPLTGAYSVYNLLAACTAATLCGASPLAVEKACSVFNPHNGRQQAYEIDGRHVLLNLAKNPTGFNQNLEIVLHDEGPKSVAFFVNDETADGHDVSWLWDVDFQELSQGCDVVAYAGGTRRNDLQVRLKYAGMDAGLVDGVRDFLTRSLESAPHARLYIIANYTALPSLKAELDHMAHMPEPQGPACAGDRRASGSRADDAAGRSSSEADRLSNAAERPSSKAERPSNVAERPSSEAERPGNAAEHPNSEAKHCQSLSGEKLVIAHLYPELLNLYGDGGNVCILAERARRRGISVEVVAVRHGERLDLSSADIVSLGGGPDREQLLAAHDLAGQAETLRAYVEDDGVLLAICGGYQLLGREWLMGEESVDGLGIVNVATTRAKGGSHNRLIGNVVLKSPLARTPVVGFENHAGRTYFLGDERPFGAVVSGCGSGNNDDGACDGILYKNVVCTYLHGPLLAKNPEVADCLIERALVRRAQKEGRTPPALPPLDDAVEFAANTYMRDRLGA